MDQEGVPAEVSKTTPLFGAYRRGGYDPEQVDRYVAEQAGRLEAAEHRASEAERRLAAAVGQLRELHRRVAVLESEDRSPQPPSLDTLGERVQRILKEAWEGAYALRQAAEQEVAELRDRASAEAEEIVATAEARAHQIDEEIERRRKAYLARLEEDRGRAVAQVSYLHEQRRAALSELLRVKELIEATVGDPAARLPGPTPGDPAAHWSGPAAPTTSAAPAEGHESLFAAHSLGAPASSGAAVSASGPFEPAEPAPAPSASRLAPAAPAGGGVPAAPSAPAGGGVSVAAPRAGEATKPRPERERRQEPDEDDEAAIVARRTALLARAGIVAEEAGPEHSSVTVRSLGALVEEARAGRNEGEPAHRVGRVHRLADDEAAGGAPEASGGVFDFDES